MHKKHGKVNIRLYYVWQTMIRRCECKSSKSYERYGERGISVCSEWRNNFQNFYEWSMSNGYDPNAKTGECTIDRIDNNGNYCPQNCRWVDVKKQGQNKRNNIIVSYNGETGTLSEISRKNGIDPKLARNRYINLKMPLEKVFSKEDLRYSEKRKGAKFIEHDGKSMNISQWAKELNVSTDVIRYKKQKGFSYEEIISILKRKGEK